MSVDKVGKPAETDGGGNAFGRGARDRKVRAQRFFGKERARLLGQVADLAVHGHFAVLRLA